MVKGGGANRSRAFCLTYPSEAAVCCSPSKHQSQNIGTRSNGRFRAAKYTSNDIKRRAGQYLLPQQVIFLVSPSFAGRDHTADYSERYAATACARKMPALNKTRTPTPNSTIKLTVCGPALSRTWVVLTSEILVRYLGRVRLDLAQRRRATKQPIRTVFSFCFCDLAIG
jgi:hypothetical protein